VLPRSRMTQVSLDANPITIAAHAAFVVLFCAVKINSPANHLNAGDNADNGHSKTRIQLLLPAHCGPCDRVFIHEKLGRKKYNIKSISVRVT
jgi:hypothetical protein